MNDAAVMVAQGLPTAQAWYLRSPGNPGTQSGLREPLAAPAARRQAWKQPETLPGSAGDLMRLLGVASDDPALGRDVSVSTRRVRAGTALFHEGARADAIHFVAVGTFKSVHIAEDGYEQVLGFAGRGEVLGYDALFSGQHPTAAVALEDSTAFGLSPQGLTVLCRRVPALDQALQHELSRQLEQRSQIAHVMAAVSAEVRLARFLLHLSDRMAERGQSARRLLLRMSRRDIASHIGVAHETVSRSFTALAHWGCLVVNNREVEIVDPELLRACASSTRGLLDGCLPRSHPPLHGLQGTGFARCAA